MIFNEFKDQKTLTIRVPTYLHATLSGLAQKRGISINKLVIEAIMKSIVG